MIQIVKQTKEEKIAMYKKLSKEEIILMLIENQEIIDKLTNPLVVINERPIEYPQNPFYPYCPPYNPNPTYITH